MSQNISPLSPPESRPAAVVLAAGLSSRMGQPKMVLPWGQGTVIERVVETLSTAGVAPIVVVTGGAREAVERALQHKPVTTAFNAEHASGDMHTSLQVGLGAMPEDVTATLVVLGDQPRMRVDVITQVIAAGRQHPDRLIVPSYTMRRGHPWLLPRSLWQAVFDLHAPQTMRDFLQSQAKRIVYVTVDTPTIFDDMDTPEDYRRSLEEEGRKGP